MAPRRWAHNTQRLRQNYTMYMGHVAALFVHLCCPCCGGPGIWCYLGSFWCLSGTNLRLQDSVLSHVRLGSLFCTWQVSNSNIKPVKSIPEIKACVKLIKAQRHEKRTEAKVFRPELVAFAPDLPAYTEAIKCQLSNPAVAEIVLPINGERPFRDKALISRTQQPAVPLQDFWTHFPFPKH